MKKYSIIFLIFAVFIFLTACTQNTAINKNNETTVEENTAEAKEQDITINTDTVVVYFSQTGITKSVAEKIAAAENADTFEIVPVTPYTSKDIDYNDKNSRTTNEQNDPNARPYIYNRIVSLDGVKKMYIGYPIWFRQAPRIMSTFVESYDLNGITVIPFCTSGSSNIGDTAKELEKQAGSGNWLDGKRFDANTTDDDIKKWIASFEQ